GLPQTSRAFESEFGRFEDARNRALEEAALASVLAGGQEQSRLFGLDLATQQAVAAQRAQQLNEVLARLGLTQVQAPTFMPNPLAGVQVPITGQTGGGGSLGAGLAGGLSGAATGAQIGSMLGGPGVGTAIAGLLGRGGGLVGGRGMARVDRRTADSVLQRQGLAQQPPRQAADRLRASG